MAYGIKYFINWKSRTNELLTFNILQKDYTGSAIELTGTDKPFTLQKQQDDILTAIQATQGATEFYNEGGTPLKSFYSEDDELYRGDFIKRDGTLLWTGYLVQDDCQEDFQSAPYKISLKFTDNLGALKEIIFDKACENTYTDAQTRPGTLSGLAITITNFTFDPFLNPDEKVLIDGNFYLIASYTWTQSTNTLVVILQTGPGTGAYDITIRINQNLLSKITLFSYLRIALQATGLAIPLRIFANIFELNQDESTDKEFLSQTRVYSGKWLDTNSAWQNIYDILNDILTSLECQLTLSGGKWVVLRRTEYLRFTDNALLGVEYDENFENPTAVTLDATFGTISPDNSVALIGANAIRKITRPFISVKETFNYEQPTQLIVGADLTLLGDFISTSTDTIDGILYRFDKYQIPTIWRHFNNAPTDTTYDASYIVVVTDVAQDVVTDRYIYQPWIDRTWKFLDFNPIEVSAGDTMDLSMSILFETLDGSDTAYFSTKLLLITPTGSLYIMLNDFGGTPKSYLKWEQLTFDDPAGTNAIWRQITGEIGLVYSQDLVNTQSWSVSSIPQDPARPLVPSFPVDGILLICVAGVTNNSGGSGAPACDMSFKDIQFSIKNNYSDTVGIKGHTHLQETTSLAKNKYDEEIKIDDSPRNPIAGTLFLETITSFDAEIGGLYFSKTSLWNFRYLTKNKKLGRYITNERQNLFGVARTRLEGTFLFSDLALDNTKILTVQSLATLQFVLGNIQEIDYMQMTLTGELWEIHTTEETTDAEYDYTFKYLYETK